MNGIEHIYFDLDHTLWDFDRNAEETLRDMFDEFELGLGIDSDFLSFLKIYKSVNERYWAAYVQGRVSQDELRLGRFADAVRDFGLVAAPDAEQLSEYYVEHCPKKQHLIPGALDLLNELKPYYRLHIITNGFKEVQHIKLAMSGLKSYFEEICTSEDAGVKKPNPQIFQFVMDKVGGRADTGVMIGDDLKTDISGARNAGMKTVYFNRFNLSHDEHSDVEVDDLKKLTPLFLANRG